uniref:Uncharacterized protein n=1 Tax=Branchiostoma floridae TaxID=7739 RepID=C3ZRG5_BRAFL|eukprot:XP_002588754.1 hypothetical protein BRAFLDRAFT_89819 [Branchiostoma floridae]
MDGEGNLWVVGRKNLTDEIAVHYDKHGKILGRIGLKSTGRWRSIALDFRSNHILITQTRTGQSLIGLPTSAPGEVEVYRPDKSLVRAVDAVFVRTVDGQQQMKEPGYLTVDREGNILVSDSGTNSVHVCNEDGKFLFQFGGFGHSRGKLYAPHGICTDREGNIIVADSGNRRLEMFDKIGRFLRHIITDIEPLAVAIATQGQLVVTFWDHTVSILKNY